MRTARHESARKLIVWCYYACVMRTSAQDTKRKSGVCERERELELRKLSVTLCKTVEDSV